MQSTDTVTDYMVIISQKKKSFFFAWWCAWRFVFDVKDALWLKKKKKVEKHFHFGTVLKLNKSVPY